MQVNSLHHNYSTSICPFESGKCEKEGKKSQKFEYLENKKSFLDEIKKFFTVFKGLSFVEKKLKNDKKLRTEAWKRTKLSSSVFYRNI